MSSAQVDQSGAKSSCAGVVAGMLSGDFVLKVGEVEGVASIFSFDAFAESNDLVRWGMVLKFLCCGFLGRSSGGGVRLMTMMMDFLDLRISMRV